MRGMKLSHVCGSLPDRDMKQWRCGGREAGDSPSPSTDSSCRLHSSIWFFPSGCDIVPCHSEIKMRDRRHYEAISSHSYDRSRSVLTGECLTKENVYLKRILVKHLQWITVPRSGDEGTAECTADGHEHFRLAGEPDQ